MYFYVMQLFNQDYREDISLAMTSSGISHATVVEGTNLDNLLERQFPFFSGLFSSAEEKERYSSVIFGMIEDREVMDAFVELLDQAGIQNKDEEIYRLILLSGEQLGT